MSTQRIIYKEEFAMKDLSGISVVLPSLDPDEKLHRVIDGLLEYGFTDIILVNDGSKKENLHYFYDEAEAHPEIHLLHHEVNRGKGAALKTAFTWFLENRPEGLGVVTVDGDDQHHPADTRACSEHMLETGHLTLGCRDFTLDHVPARSRFGNHTTSLVFKIFCGMTISDTQTGLRAIPRNDLVILNEVYGDRFEYETNMLLALKENGIPFDEVKIRTVYIEENKSSHFRAIRDSWRIYKLILAHFFRYTISSIVSFVVDSGLVYVLTRLLAALLTAIPGLNFVPTVIARVVSSLLNFFMNKKLVFHAKTDTRKSMLRYYALAIPQLFAQSLLEMLAFTLFRVGAEQAALRTLIHIIIMTVLFVISFTVQQRWVFAPDKKEKN